MTPIIFLVILSLCHVWVASAVKCIPSCECSLDDRGRQKISCTNGGLVGPLDVSRMDNNIEVLEISAPKNNTNSLKIGPIFGVFANIEEIHITHSNIPEIGMYSFYTLSTLEVLNLRDNNITTVLFENFFGLKNLKKLYLDGNRIQQLTSGSFKNLTSLRVLSLAGNQLTLLVNRVFEKLDKLEELNLSGNKFTVLNPEVFADIKELKILQCRHCGLITINVEMFKLIPKLTTLDLGENKLTSIEDLTQLTNLVSLWLDGNNFQSLPEGMFSAQTGLKKLNLARNQLNHIHPGALAKCMSLMDLDLSKNMLTHLDAKLFEGFNESLQQLDISSTEIPVAEFKYVLRSLIRLRHLNLANLDLSELPMGLFDFNSELLKLNMSRNIFVYFPVGVLSPVAHLQELDFAKNRLRGLDEKSLQRLEMIDVVRMEGNPWSCDLCHIIPMLLKLNKTFYLQDMECERPYKLRGRKLVSVEISELKKCSNNDLYYDSNDFNIVHKYFIEEGRLGIIAVGAGLLLLIMTIFALLVGVCYSRRHAANYYTHEDKRTVEEDPMFDNSEMLFGENGELNFKFPLDKKISISTIDEIKKDPDLKSIKNGT